MKEAGTNRDTGQSFGGENKNKSHHRRRELELDFPNIIEIRGILNHTGMCSSGVFVNWIIYFLLVFARSSWFQFQLQGLQGGKLCGTTADNVVVHVEFDFGGGDGGFEMITGTPDDF